MSIATRLMLALVAALFLSTASYAEGVSGKNKIKSEQQADPFALPPAVIASSWTGCHASAFGGGVSGVMDPGYGVDGYLYGLGIGCDMQLNRIVLGGFVDHAWMHVTQFGGVDAREWSFGGRAGVLLTDNTLLYGLVSRPQLNIDGMGSVTGFGWGGGLETKLGGLANNWTAVLEYRQNTFDDIPDAREHQVRFGINVTFPVPGMPK